MVEQIVGMSTKKQCAKSRTDLAVFEGSRQQFLTVIDSMKDKFPKKIWLQFFRRRLFVCIKNFIFAEGHFIRNRRSYIDHSKTARELGYYQYNRSPLNFVFYAFNLGAAKLHIRCTLAILRKPKKPKLDSGKLIDPLSFILWRSF